MVYGKNIALEMTCIMSVFYGSLCMQWGGGGDKRETFSPHGRVWKNMILFLFMNNQCILWRSYMQEGRIRDSEMATVSLHGRFWK